VGAGAEAELMWAGTPAAPPRLRVWRLPCFLEVECAIDLLKSLKVPFLAMYPSLRRCKIAFFPAACFLREMMRPLCFIRSDFFKPPEVFSAELWNTSAFDPTVLILCSVISILNADILFVS